MITERKIFTLKQVTLSIQKIISERYQQLYWVQTEMHKLNFTTKGHCYPELVHKEGNTIVAEMRATIWKSNFDKISKNFAKIVKEPLRDGMNLLILVKISFHPLYGMGLEIIDIDPTYSLGELEKERKESLIKLKNEGLLNLNQQLNFPLLPKRIAIISVESSKGLSDFYSIINNNPWNYQFFFMLFQAQLNGDAAIDSIQQQLKKIQKVKHHFDVVLIIRGGGGEIGLSCFNNYFLSKAIATFPLPILTGIGHSTNITVTEMVAFRNAITPTELADMLIQAFHDFSLPLDNGRKSIIKEAKIIINNNKIELKTSVRFIGKNSFNFISNCKNKLTIYGYEIKQSSLHLIKQKELERVNLKNSLKNGIDFCIKNQGYFLEQTINKVIPNINKFIEKEKTILHLFKKSIELIDPKTILKRGYSLTLKNGKIISLQNKLSIGDEIETFTVNQIIKSEIKTINKLIE